jgi:hypothetical protein
VFNTLQFILGGLHGEALVSTLKQLHPVERRCPEGPLRTLNVNARDFKPG